ncbi:MAG: hypothetical protein AABZ39_04910 [Spirochaetota bacterium]
MGCNAHRIDKIVYAEHESFSLWHDNVLEVMEAANCNKTSEIHDHRNYDGIGTIEVPVALLKIAVENEKVSEYIKEAIRMDIAFAEKRGDDYVLYDCY